MKRVKAAFLVGLVLIALGALLYGVFALSPQMVAVDGGLEEQFWALALGAFFAAAGLAVVTVTGIVILTGLRRRRSAHSRGVVPRAR